MQNQSAYPHTGERPVEAPSYADEWIEFWAGVYRANPAIGARGVLFETFLAYPHEILRACAAPVLIIQCRGELALASRAMVGAMRELAAAATLALERSGARCENGRFVEKMRHHRHPQSRAAFKAGS